IGVALHQDDGFGIFIEYTGQFVQGGGGGSLDIGFIGIEIHPVLTTEGNVDALPHSFHFGTWEFFLDTFALPVHPVADITTGSTASHSTDYGAQGGVANADVVSDDSTNDGSPTGPYGSPFLGPIRVFYRIAAHNQAQN